MQRSARREFFAVMFVTDYKTITFERAESNSTASFLKFRGSQLLVDVALHAIPLGAQDHFFDAELALCFASSRRTASSRL